VGIRRKFSLLEKVKKINEQVVDESIEKWRGFAR
jgi:hypothetical protein